jgi:hypothetical protein
MSLPRDHSTSEQLRADIDRGATGSKIPWPDPAVVPLGADEEAAGSPPPGPIIDQTVRAETEGAVSPPDVRRGLGAAWILVGAVVLIGIGIAAASLL